MRKRVARRDAGRRVRDNRPRAGQSPNPVVSRPGGRSPFETKKRMVRDSNPRNHFWFVCLVNRCYRPLSQPSRYVNRRSQTPLEGDYYFSASKARESRLCLLECPRDSSTPRNSSNNCHYQCKVDAINVFIQEYDRIGDGRKWLQILPLADAGYAG